MSDGLGELLSSSGHGQAAWGEALGSLGLQTKTDLLLRTASPRQLAELQQRLSERLAGAPASLAAELRRLAQRSRLVAGGFPDPSPETQSPVLFTAPHSIYLRREGHAHHVPEWHTSDLARKFARAVKAAFLTWTKDEERRNKELFDIAGEPDGTNSDPNFTLRGDLCTSPWTCELRELREKFGPRPCLHVDLHGCRNPRQNRGSHVVVGLKAMELAGREGVENLRRELQLVLSIVLKGFIVSVHPQKSLTGALEDDRCTLTQQSLSVEGGAWTHAVQIELCARLRKVLSESTTLQTLLAQGILIAWVMAFRLELGVGWLPARTQCVNTMQEWMARCTDFHSRQDIAADARPKRRKKALKAKAARASDESEEEPERLSANNEASGFLCAGPSPELAAELDAEGEELWLQVWEAMRRAAEVARPGPQAGAGEVPGPRPAEAARLSGELSSRRAKGDGPGEVAALLSLAELHAEDGSGGLALRVAEEARALARELGDTAQEAEAIRAVANARLLQGSIDDAGTLAEQEMARFQEAGDINAEAFMQLVVADVLMKKGRSREAHRLAESASDVFRRLGNRKGEASAVEALASTSFSLGYTKRTLKAAERALSLYRSLGKKKMQAAMLRAMASVYTRAAQGPEAMESALESHDLCLELGDRKGEAASLNAMASAHLIRGDGAADALDAALRAMRLSREVTDMRGQVAAWSMLARAHLSLGDLQEALAAANEALGLSRTLEDLGLMAGSMETIMGIYSQTGAGSKALLKAKAEFRLARTSSSVKMLAATLQWIASAQQMCNQGDEAVKNAVQARELLKNAQDRKGEALACNVLATYLAAVQRWPEALGACEESAALHRELGDVPGVAQALQLKADLCWQQDDQDGALEAARQQQRAYQEASYKEEEADALLRTSEMVCKTKGVQAALKSVKAARLLFQECGDRESEAKALLQIADLHLEDEGLSLALKVAKEAQEVSQAAENTRGEADALLTIARVHLMQSEAAAENGKSSGKQGLRDAILAAEMSRKSYESLEDAEGLAASLQLASRCYLCSVDGEGALQAAGDALELNELLENPRGCAAALLSAAMAQRLLREHEAALGFASRAASLAAEIGDTAAQRQAEQLLALLASGGEAPADAPCTRAAPCKRSAETLPVQAANTGASARRRAGDSDPAVGECQHASPHGALHRPARP